MKKYLVPAGILCSAAVVGTIAYRKLKKTSTNDIVFYPMGRYIIHTNDGHKSLETLIKEADIIVHAKITGKSNPMWNNRENRQPKTVTAKDLVYFDYLVQPLMAYKGSLTDCSELRLRSTEGSIGGYTLEDNSQPKLMEDQHVILLLKNGVQRDFKYDRREFHTLCGNLDGVYTVNGETVEGHHGTYKKAVFDMMLKTSMNP